LANHTRLTGSGVHGATSLGGTLLAHTANWLDADGLQFDFFDKNHHYYSIVKFSDV